QVVETLGARHLESQAYFGLESLFYLCLLGLPLLVDLLDVEVEAYWDYKFIVSHVLLFLRFSTDIIGHLLFGYLALLEELLHVSLSGLPVHLYQVLVGVLARLSVAGRHLPALRFLPETGLVGQHDR